MQRNQIVGLSVLGLVAAGLILAALRLHSDVRQATQWVLAWAALESVIGFYGLSWSVSRSNKIFYSLFGAGTLIRLLSLLVVTFVLYKFGISLTIPLLSLVGAYFLFSLIEIPFLKSYGLR